MPLVKSELCVCEKCKAILIDARISNYPQFEVDMIHVKDMVSIPVKNNFHQQVCPNCYSADFLTAVKDVAFLNSYLPLSSDDFKLLDLDIKTIDDVKTFIRYVINDLKLVFHPDTPFDDYVISGTFIPLFSPQQAFGLNNLLISACLVCSKSMVDIYELCDQVEEYDKMVATIKESQKLFSMINTTLKYDGVFAWERQVIDMLSKLARLRIFAEAE